MNFENILIPLNDKKVQIVYDSKIHLYPPIGVYEASLDLLRMIQWLGEESVADWKETHTAIEAEKAINRRPALRDALSVRLGSRTLSYVNHLFLLNGILKRGIERTYTILKEKKIDGHIDPVIYQEKVDRLKVVFEPIETFRHKIAAHTSFSMPKNDDDLTQLDSLINLLPDKGSHILGNKSFGYTTNENLAVVSIINYESDVVDYFTEWADLYTYVLEPLKKYFTYTRGRIEVE